MEDTAIGSDPTLELDLAKVKGLAKTRSSVEQALHVRILRHRAELNRSFASCTCGVLPYDRVAYGVYMFAALPPLSI